MQDVGFFQGYKTKHSSTFNAGCFVTERTQIEADPIQLMMRREELVDAGGIEPPTCRLRVECSAS